MTILPASEKDVYLIAFPQNQNESDLSNRNSLDVNETNSSENLYEKKSDSFEQISPDNSNSNRSNTPLDNAKTTESEGLLIPVYVYNCSLALLIDALIEKLESPRNKDIYQDHTFRVGQKDREEFLHSKLINSMKTSSPEPKSEDSDNATSGSFICLERIKIKNKR